MSVSVETRPARTEEGRKRSRVFGRMRYQLLKKPPKAVSTSSGDSSAR